MNIRDTTDREKEEEAYRNAEAHYRTIFEQSPNGILLVDPETGETIRANKAAHKHLGYTQEEFAALKISDYEVLETPEETAAEVLLEQFDNADTNSDDLLTFEEALVVLASLTQTQFDELDTNNDGFLSREEAEAYLEDGSGCFSNCRKTKNTEDYVKRMISDWLLMGLSLTVLLVMTKQ